MARFLSPEILTFMLKGAGVSIALAFGALVIGAIIGIIMASAKLSHSKIFNAIGTCYVEIFRGTPMLLQILFIFLGVPVIITMMTGSRFRMNVLVVALIALSLNSGAYQTELIRSGIQGVDKGQWEACETLGISYWSMMKEIILPQAFKRIVPPLVSEFITLIKDSSLASCIGCQDLMYNTQALGAKYYNYLYPLIIASVMYLLMTLVVSWIGKKIEARFAVSD